MTSLPLSDVERTLVVMMMLMICLIKMFGKMNYNDIYKDDDGIADYRTISADDVLTP